MSVLARKLFPSSPNTIINHVIGAIRALSIKPEIINVTEVKQKETEDFNRKSNEEHKKEIFQNVNELLRKKEEGRLFAVIQLCGKQFKVTAGDIILVEGYWPPTIGDRIRLDKVLLAGGNDFTLVGKPLVQPGLVDVQATIIEKTLTHTKTHFRKKRRKQYMRINFYRLPNTMIRINSVEIKGRVNDKQGVNDLKIF